MHNECGTASVDGSGAGCCIGGRCGGGGLSVGTGFIDPEADDPPDEDGNVEGSGGVEEPVAEVEGFLQFCLVVRSGGLRDELPDGLDDQATNGCSGEADGDALGVTLPGSLEFPSEDDDHQAKLNVQEVNEELGLLSDELEDPEGGDLRLGGEGLPGGPGSPDGQDAGGDEEQADEVDDQLRAMDAGKGLASQLSDDQQSEDRHNNGKGDEDGGEGELGQALEELAFTEQAERHGDDGGGEPREAADPIAAQEDDDENELRRESKGPEDLRCREVPIEVHFCLVRAARFWCGPLG